MSLGCKLKPKTFCISGLYPILAPPRIPQWYQLNSKTLRLSGIIGPTLKKPINSEFSNLK